jgi:hypothetical protein
MCVYATSWTAKKELEVAQWHKPSSAEIKELAGRMGMQDWASCRTAEQ